MLFFCVFLGGLRCMSKKGKLVSGFALSCHAFSRRSVCGGIASCFLASLQTHVCVHVRYDGKKFSLSVVWASHINHSAVYILRFYPSDFLSFFHQSVISAEPHRPPWLKCGFIASTAQMFSRSIFFPFFALEKHIRNLSSFMRNTFLCSS